MALAALELEDMVPAALAHARALAAAAAAAAAAEQQEEEEEEENRMCSICLEEVDPPWKPCAQTWARVEGTPPLPPHAMCYPTTLWPPYR